MPEGDLLRRVARRLSSALADGPLVRCELRWPDVEPHAMLGTHTRGTVSYGKHLLTRFDDGSTLHTHLRMDGSWRVTPTRSLRAPAPGGFAPQDVRAVLATSAWTCWGLNLGMLDLLRTRDEPRLLAHLGPDLLADDIDSRIPAAAAAVVAHGGSIGETLLDQRVAAGIGTIWMSETLFRHRISPLRPAREVTPEEAASLLTTAARLMRASADGAPAPGQPGSVRIAAHGRLGKPCPRCGTPIAVVPVAPEPYSRPAFYCPACQRR